MGVCDDLISREALRSRMYHEAFEVDNGMQRWDSGLWIRYKIFEKVIEETPAVDFQEVVRCKDCVYAIPYNERWTLPKKSNCLWCKLYEDIRTPCWFCADGERGEENAEIH